MIEWYAITHAPEIRALDDGGPICAPAEEDEFVALRDPLLEFRDDRSRPNFRIYFR